MKCWFKDGHGLEAKVFLNVFLASLSPRTLRRTLLSSSPRATPVASSQPRSRSRRQKADRPGDIPLWILSSKAEIPTKWQASRQPLNCNTFTPDLFTDAHWFEDFLVEFSLLLGYHCREVFEDEVAKVEPVDHAEGGAVGEVERPRNVV